MRTLLAVGLASSLGVGAVAQSTLRPLPEGPGFRPTAIRAINHDGSAVAGYAVTSDGEPLTYWWSEREGYRVIQSTLTRGAMAVRGMSGDGRTVVGFGVAPGTGWDQALKWTPETGVVRVIGFTPSVAESASFDGGAVFVSAGNSSWRVASGGPSVPIPIGVMAGSADGLSAVGYGGPGLAVWSERQGVRPLQPPPPGVTPAYINLISADGRVVAGSALWPPPPGGGVLVWVDGAFAGVPAAPNGATSVQALGLSADGRVILASYAGGSGYFVSRDGVPRDLGELLDPVRYSATGQRFPVGEIPALSGDGRHVGLWLGNVGGTGFVIATLPER